MHQLYEDLKKQFPYNEVTVDRFGYPSVMVFIPRFRLCDVMDCGVELVHPAFVKDGEVLDGIYVSKYQNSLQNGVACSLPDRDPAVCINFDEAREACAQKGDGWHLMTAMEWGAVALWCQKNGFLPSGNNDGGKDIRETCVTARISYRDEEKGVLRTACGTGPVEWFHNRRPDGIADLNGNVWEWIDGVRLVFGELQLGLHDEWYALNAKTGEYIPTKEDGVTEGSVKLDFRSERWVWTGGVLADVFPKPRHCLFSKVRADDLVGENARQALYAMGLLPWDESFDYGGVSLYANNGKEERMMFRGGRYGQGIDAGVFKTCLDDPRTASGEMIGFRSVFYGK